MNDFNRGALQVPCLRLDYGFGEQWASVELGDGTGYVRLSDYEKAEDENAKLRELVRIAIKYCDSGTCDGCPILGEDESCPYSDMARELGIEVD